MTARLPEGTRDSPINWRAGDVAVSTAESPWWNPGTREYGPGPAKGALSRVTAVIMVEGRQFLRLREWPGTLYCAAAFTKLRSDRRLVEQLEPKRVDQPREVEHA